jgi:uncharacterized protein (DUF169 family)
MTLTKEDLAILDKFDFDVQPVGVKFLTKRPDMVERLDENMAFCEMLKRAQEGNAFFADAENHTCEAGLYVLGQADALEPYVSGEFGAGLKIFEEPRSASRLYLYIPKIGRGVVNYVAFSPLDKLPFEPDVLIILAKTSQTEILLRAMSYRTGKMWLSKFSPAIGCAWTYIYPYLSGELNYSITGLGHGMKRRKLFPEGQQIISIPFDLLSSLLQTLQDMPWVLPAYKPDGAEFVRRLLIELALPRPCNLFSLARQIADGEGLARTELRLGSRKREVVKARRLFCQVAVGKMGYSGAEVARFLGVTTSVVNRLAASEESPKLAEYV